MSLILTDLDKKNILQIKSISIGMAKKTERHRDMAKSFRFKSNSMVLFNVMQMFQHKGCLASRHGKQKKTAIITLCPEGRSV